MATKPSRRPTQHATSASEWVVAALGAFLVAAAIGYLLYFESSTSSRPPKIEVMVRNIEPSGERYLVSFDVRNDSPRTAATLRVGGELSEHGTVERRVVVFDYVPAFSTRHGGLLFRNDPEKGELMIAPLSFINP